MADEQSGAKPTIRMSNNGPLLVKGLQRLRNSKGEQLEVARTIALCRCGGSANKPFCDGTHARNGFSGENTADRNADRQERYQGPELTIVDNRFICAHVGACTDGLPEVFRYGQEPWIDPTGADAARIESVIRQCPSGALTFARGGDAVRDFGNDPAITVSRNGPYYVVGGCELDTDAWGEGASREHYALCRCGQSRNKPFCDGSHWEAGFEDPDN